MRTIEFALARRRNFFSAKRSRNIHSVLHEIESEEDGQAELGARIFLYVSSCYVIGSRLMCCVCTARTRPYPVRRTANNDGYQVSRTVPLLLPSRELPSQMLLRLLLLLLHSKTRRRCFCVLFYFFPSPIFCFSCVLVNAICFNLPAVLYTVFAMSARRVGVTHACRSRVSQLAVRCGSIDAMQSQPCSRRLQIKLSMQILNCISATRWQMSTNATQA